MHAGQLIRQARRQARLSQVELAEMAGTTQSLVSRYESRRAQPSYAMVERLVRAAGLEMQVELVESVLPFGGGPVAQALARHRELLAGVLDEVGVTRAEIAGQAAEGQDVPGAFVFLLVHRCEPLTADEIIHIQVALEIELHLRGKVFDADRIPTEWADQVAGPRLPIHLDVDGDVAKGE